MRPGESVVQTTQGDAKEAATDSRRNRRRFLQGGLTVAAGALTYAVPKVAVAANAKDLSPGLLPLDLEITFDDVVSELTGDFSGSYRSSGEFKLAIDAQQNCTLSDLRVQGSPVSGSGFGPFTLQQNSPIAANCSSLDNGVLVVGAPPVTAVFTRVCAASVTVQASVTAIFGAGGVTYKKVTTITVTVACSNGTITTAATLSISFQS